MLPSGRGRRRTSLRVALIVLMVWGAAAAETAAQETRREQLDAARRDKAATLEPHDPNLVERALFLIEDRLLLARIFGPPRGFFLRAGGLREGGGFGWGPGFRLGNHDVQFTISAAGSALGYFSLDASLITPRRPEAPVFGGVTARRIDYPQEDFFGLGPDSSLASRANFALRETSVTGLGGVRPTDWLTVGGRLAYLEPAIGHGTDDAFPSIEEVFDPETVPGISERTSFVRGDVYVDLDTRDPQLAARSGSRLLVTWSRYDDRDLDRFGSNRLEVDAQQFLGVLHGHRVLALRAWFATTSAASGQQVPFYFQPVIGGKFTLRSFRRDRFRDLHALLLQAEYRYEVNPFVTGVVFVDAGDVVSSRSDLDVARLRTSYGLGVRGGTPQGVGYRIEIAFGGEGPRLVTSFSNVF